MLNKSIKSKLNAMRILEMIAPHAVTMLGPGELDRPRNALSMVPRFHTHFGELNIVFEPASALFSSGGSSSSGTSVAGDDIDGGCELEYTVIALDPDLEPFLSTERIALNARHQTVETPSPLLLQIHRAAAKILHASAAGEYIERLLRDRNKGSAKADGSTNLGALVAMGLSCKHALVRS
jgi:hypothetical protein